MGFLLKATGKMHRTFRNEHWKKFCKSEPSEQKKSEVLPYDQSLKNRPDHISLDHWKRFLDARCSTEAEMESKRNAANRAKGAPATHNQGRRNIKNLKLLLSGGKEPSRIDIFEATKSKVGKDGNREWLHHSSVEGFGKMDKLTQEGKDEEDAFREVIGPEHPGSVHCTGSSHTINSWYRFRNGGGKSLVTAQCQILSSEISGLKEQLKAREEEENKRRIEEEERRRMEEDRRRLEEERTVEEDKRRLEEERKTQEELQSLRAQISQLLQLMTKSSI